MPPNSVPMGDPNPDLAGFTSAHSKLKTQHCPKKPMVNLLLYASPVPTTREIDEPTHLVFCGCQRKFNNYNGLRITQMSS